MPQYDIYVTCSECGREHPMGVAIHLNYGPDDKQSLSDAYGYKSLSPYMPTIEAHKCLCLKTGKEFKQEDNTQVFLVPVRRKQVSGYSH
jgi:hypothetical protein